MPRDAGIVFVPVEHEGNGQASDEEAAALWSKSEEIVSAL